MDGWMDGGWDGARPVRPGERPSASLTCSERVITCSRREEARWPLQSVELVFSVTPACCPWHFSLRVQPVELQRGTLVEAIFFHLSNARYLSEPPDMSDWQID